MNSNLKFKGASTEKKKELGKSLEEKNVTEDDPEAKTAVYNVESLEDIEHIERTDKKKFEKCKDEKMLKTEKKQVTLKTTKRKRPLQMLMKNEANSPAKVMNKPTEIKYSPVQKRGGGGSKLLHIIQQFEDIKGEGVSKISKIEDKAIFKSNRHFIDASHAGIGQNFKIREDFVSDSQPESRKQENGTRQDQDGGNWTANESGKIGHVTRKEPVGPMGTGVVFGGIRNFDILDQCD